MADPRLSLQPIQRLSSPTAMIENPLRQARTNTPYATNLVDFSHKFKFLFVVDITFKPNFAALGQNGYALLVQTATRPSPKFEFEEINLYGVRTQITKSTKYNPMTMTFLDDTRNNMMNFFTNAVRWMSPVSSLHQTAQFEDWQYDFKHDAAINNDGPKSGAKILSHSYAASANPERFIDTITMHHIYEYGNLVNSYHYTQPVITELVLDDLDMKSDEPTSLKMSFDYISVTYEIAKPVTQSIVNLVGDTMFKLRHDL